MGFPARNGEAGGVGAGAEDGQQQRSGKDGWTTKIRSRRGAKAREGGRRERILRGHFNGTWLMDLRFRASAAPGLPDIPSAVPGS